MHNRQRFRPGRALTLALLLVAVAVVALPTGDGVARAAPRAPAAVERTAAATANGTIVYYTSSVDGFNLSYQEFLPAGYDPSAAYPLAVELHGIATDKSTPLPGGYIAPEVETTVDAASAAGFILLVADTRTGDGYYTDSPYTGPQAQDILDAIAHEQALRRIDRTYLYGFSMGGMGALALGLAHPGLFAGLGAIATESDMYELTSYSSSVHSRGVTDALLNVSGGYPNNSTFAASVFDFLSALRQHPEAARGLRMYFTAGGADLSIPDNAATWPYLQANDSLLETSCLSIATWHEPANCTTPLASYAAVDPANYSFRFVYEPTAPHDYGQMNATDLFAYFDGSVGSGLFVGNFPDPTPTPPAVPLVTVATSPFSCGTIALDGIPYANGATMRLAVGNHSVAPSSCPGTTLASVAGTGGVAYDVANASIDVTGSGAIVARFAAPPPPSASVEFLALPPCPFGTLNGTSVSAGTTRSLPLGTYAIAAGSCPPDLFRSWVTTGAVAVGDSIAGTTSLTVRGNGTVEPTYASAGTVAAVSVAVVPPACGPVAVNGTSVASGTQLSLPLGPVAIVAGTCTGYEFVTWTSGGGVTLGGPGPEATATIASSGNLTAVYVPSTTRLDRVNFSVAPPACGPAILLDGVAYGDGSSGWLLPGDHAIASAPCNGYTFAGWSSSGGASVSGSDLAITGNGSVSVSYRANGSAPPRAATNATSTVPAWAWGVAGAAAGGVVVAAILLAVRRRPKNPPAP